MKKFAIHLALIVFNLLFFNNLSAQDTLVVNATDTLNITDEKGRKQGYWVKMFEDNKVYEGTFKDDIPVGKFVYYYDNGTPWSISYFSENGRVTHTQMYDGSGVLMGEGKYIDKKKDSLWKYYNHEGILISIETFKNGIRHGISKTYYPSGALLEEKTWKDGEINGPCKKYFENGQIRYDGNLVNGLVEGQLTFYYSNGQVHATGLYENDLKTGIWKYYTKDGKLDHIEEYINGRLQGEDPNIVPWDDERMIQEQKQQEQNQIRDPFEEQ